MTIKQNEWFDKIHIWKLKFFENKKLKEKERYRNLVRYYVTICGIQQHVKGLQFRRNIGPALSSVRMH